MPVLSLSHRFLHPKIVMAEGQMQQLLLTLLLPLLLFTNRCQAATKTVLLVVDMQVCGACNSEFLQIVQSHATKSYQPGADASQVVFSTL